MVIDVLRERPAASRLSSLEASEHAAPLVCAVTVEEIWRGARLGEEPAIARLLAALRIAPLGREEGERAGSWRREFGARGITLGQADCLIAAAAVSVGARLATANVRDFPMPELEVEHWPPGG